MPDPWPRSTQPGVHQGRAATDDLNMQFNASVMQGILEAVAFATHAETIAWRCQPCCEHAGCYTLISSIDVAHSDRSQAYGLHAIQHHCV